jgi:hypothetical protein
MAKSKMPPFATSIRPVVRAFPLSSTMLEQSSLPFAVTLAPLDDEPLPTTNAEEHVRLLSSIPKCVNCGAPHACEGHTFYQSDEADGAVLLCYLCGRVSEVVGPQVMPSSSSQLGGPNQSGMQVFELPLRLGPNYPQSSVSAFQCPLLWIIILDGSCHERSYVRCGVLRSKPQHRNSLDAFFPFLYSGEGHQKRCKRLYRMPHLAFILRLEWPRHERYLNKTNRPKIRSLYLDFSTFIRRYLISQMRKCICSMVPVSPVRTCWIICSTSSTLTFGPRSVRWYVQQAIVA